MFNNLRIKSEDGCLVATDEKEGGHIWRQCFQPAHVERATDCSFPRNGQRPGLNNAKHFNLHCAIAKEKMGHLHYNEICIGWVLQQQFSQSHEVERFRLLSHQFRFFNHWDYGFRFRK
jgi:hypothetical protein